VTTGLCPGSFYFPDTGPSSHLGSERSAGPVHGHGAGALGPGVVERLGLPGGAGVLDGVDSTDGSASDEAPAEVRVAGSDGALVASTSGRTVVLLGVPGVVVVDTPDALLVTTPEHAQDVKGVVDALKEDGREDLL